MLEGLFELRTRRVAGAVTAAFLSSPAVAGRMDLLSHRANAEGEDRLAFGRCMAEANYGKNTTLLDQPWNGLPALMFQVGAGEALADDSRTAATLVTQAGGVAELDVIPHTPRAVALLSDWCPEGDQALGRAVDWLKAQVLKRSSQ